MDEKHQHQPQIMASPRRYRARELLLVIMCFFVGVHLWTHSVAVPFLPQQAAEFLAPTQDDGSVNGLVPFEAHIISKCPDTRHALRNLILPVMQKVHDKVDFTLSYIGPLPTAASTASTAPPSASATSSNSAPTSCIPTPRFTWASSCA
ncbi:hypothetical protein J3F84DRAFT_260057 [Trichoderma pleuroticola]